MSEDVLKDADGHVGPHSPSYSSWNPKYMVSTVCDSM